MGSRVPYTKRERRLIAQDFGYRPVNDWGDGDLPCPWAQGDLVRLDGEVDDDRMRGVPPHPQGLYVISYACSIDEGDAWYMRVGTFDEKGYVICSDRLHVAYTERCQWDTAVDYMAPFTLIDTVDPEGLALRERLIADGWSFEQRWDTCDACGATKRKAGA